MRAIIRSPSHARDNKRLEDIIYKNRSFRKVEPFSFGASRRGLHSTTAPGSIPVKSYIYREIHNTHQHIKKKKKKTAVEIVIFIDATPNALVYSDTLY